MADRRSDEARAYRRLYSTTSWKRRRLEQLAAEPLCRLCAAYGHVTAASVADHITPHRGDRNLFDGPLQSLCASCHSAAKQRYENGGWDSAADADGYPLCPRHPQKKFERSSSDHDARG